MKEYLLKTEDGKWIHSNTGESFSYVEKIEIPEGAEVFMDGFNTNRGYAFYKDNFDMVHGDNRYWEECSKWDISKNAVVRWQREPKYKEFLNANDNYNLVMLPEHAGDDERSGLIEVPDGAEQLTKLGLELVFWKDNGNFSWHTENSTEWDDNIKHQLTTLNMYGMQYIVWQRPQQPESLPFIDDEVQSLNDQYAEIEQVRQQTIDATLAERQSTYGCFEDVAFVTENIINVLKKCNYNKMPHTHRMAMYMIASKMARLVNGDCNHLDSWHDIGGYAKLIENLIKENNNG